MIVFLAGGIYGKIDSFFEKVFAVEKEHSVRADYILQVGNLGCYPDVNHVDKAMRDHGGAGDFPKWYAQQKPFPRKTVFVPGRREDHQWMSLMLSKRRMELLPNLVWLVNGYSMDLEFGTVLGLGKVYSPLTYNNQKTKKSLAHYNRNEVEKACSQGPVDIMLCHESIDSPGLKNIKYATRPKFAVSSRKGNDFKEDAFNFKLGEQQIVVLRFSEDKSFSIL